MTLYFDSIMQQLPDPPQRNIRKSSSQACKDMDNITTTSLYTASVYEGDIVINIYGVWKSCYGFLQEGHFHIFESSQVLLQFVMISNGNIEEQSCHVYSIE